MRRERAARVRRYLSFSLRDMLVTVLIFAATLAVCLSLSHIDSGNEYVSMIFILSVFLTSRFTSGYLFGIVSALVSVLAVNYVFTYPYYEFNFTLSGYPLAMLCMLIVAATTSTLTTRIKQHSIIRMEAEREKMRSNLLRAVSHDLRTPLTSILGASSAIIDNDDKLDKAERIRLLTEINEDAMWLIRMVENLLSVTRIDGDRGARIVKKNEAAEEVVAEAIGKFRKNFPDAPLTVEVPDELLMVPMDALLIEQVIINLLENAAQHAQSATQICLLVYKDSENAVFEVSDDGIGLPDEVLARVTMWNDNGVRINGFQLKRLKRQKVATRRVGTMRSQGTRFRPLPVHRPPALREGDGKRNMGIGLSVCYTIVAAHNGAISARNGEEGGAVFSFTLPLEDKK